MNEGHPARASDPAGTGGAAGASRSAIWMGTAAVSVVAHAVALVALAALMSSIPLASRATLGLATFSVDDAAMFVDVATDKEGDAPVAPTVPALPTALAVPVPAGAEGDRSRHADRPVAAEALPPSTRSRARPAADTGRGEGQRLVEPAWRRDTSTLHERLTDGAHDYQPSREATAPRALPTSPQAVRREPTTGTGDSARARPPSLPAPAASYPAPATADDQPGGPTRDGQTQDDALRLVAAESPRPGPEVAPGQGPLDADRGARSLDVPAAGARAADAVAARAASNEPRPGITDFSLASAPGSSERGRGPGRLPGAVAARSEGTAASVPGRHGMRGGEGDEETLRERTYDRYEQEIRRRVGRAQVFPKELALRLEQGETLLRFVLQPDGRLTEAARVVKSSGFEAFDQAALDAVRQALPFPAMPDRAHAGPRAINMLVEFSNPVIR